MRRAKGSLGAPVPVRPGPSHRETLRETKDSTKEEKEELRFCQGGSD